MLQGSLFARRDFRLLLLGQSTSQLGTQVSAVAIPLLAVVALHCSSLEVGVINASSTLAFALVALPAGAWLDRWRRRRVLVVSDLARAALLATIPVAAWLGMLSVAQLVVVSLLVGLARVFFDVGYQSYLPSVVGTDDLLAGNSSLELVRASGQVVGPGLGGTLVSLLGAASVVAVQAVTFAVSAVTLIAIGAPEAPLPRRSGRSALWTEVAEGLGLVARNGVLRATAVAGAAINFSFAVASAVNFIFLSRTLGLAPAAIGLLIAAGSLTVVLGAALTPRLARAVGSARIIWLSLAATTPFTLLGVAARPGWSVALVVVGIAAGELGQIVYAITTVSLRQRIAPERVLGRVNATLRFLIMSLFPLGALVGGLLGELLGARATLAAAGGVLLLCPVVLYRALRGARDIDQLSATARGVPQRAIR